MTAENKKITVVPLKLDDDKLAVLDFMALVSGTNRSVVLRELIPDVSIAEAMFEHERLAGCGTGRHVVSNIAYNFVFTMSRLMIEDMEYPIRLQVDIVVSGIDPFIKASQLFMRWARAKQGVEGYLFDSVQVGDREFFLAIGPDDSEKYIDSLKAKLIDYAKKLYA